MPEVVIPEVHPVALEMLAEPYEVGMEIANSHTEHTMRVVAGDLTRLEQAMEMVQEDLDDVPITATEWCDAMAPFVINNNTVTVANTATALYTAGTMVGTANYVAIPDNARMIGNPGRSPESDYFLDGLFSCNDITPDVDRFVRMAGFNMDNWLDNYDWNTNRRENHGENLMMSGRALREHYLEWRTNASADERAAVSISSLYGLSQQISEFLWSASDKCAIKLITEPPERPVAEVITNPDFIGQTILSEERLSLWVGDVADYFTFLRSDYEEGDPEGILRCVQNYINRPSCFGTYINANTTINGRVTMNAHMRGKPKPVSKATIKRVRQAVKRSSALFERIIGAEELRWFLAGKPFRIRGELFTYEIAKTQSVILHTADPRGHHVPYNLTILDGEKRLCKVCIYFDKTPLLDQITALAMFIKSGEEEALIRKANMFDRCPDYDDHPIMRRLGKTRVNIQRGTAVRSTNAAEIENTIRIVADDSFIRSFGVSNRQFKEEVVPWRASLRDPVLGVFANMIGMPKPLIDKLASADRNGDEMAFWRRLNAPTAEAFIEHNFA